jgi:hypothetical protein
MAIDGTYGFVYCGVNGLGLGVFTVADGVFRGRDYGGGTYEGSAREIADGTIDLALSFEVRPGMFLVQGTAAQDAPPHPPDRSPPAARFRRWQAAGN